jgi:small subunit ribosomal protein S16
MLKSDHAERVVLNQDRIKYWLSVGAEPTDRVNLFLANANIVKDVVRTANPKKSAPKKKAQQRLKEEAEKAAAAASE